jgi:hypothetical protein
MFKEQIDLTDPRYSEKANLEYACFKTRAEVIKLEEHPTTDEEYLSALAKYQYYWRLLI